MIFDADLPLFYADFGTTATHTPAGGAASDPALVLFSLPGANALGGGLVMTAPVVQYPAGSFPSVARGDTFSINGATWRVSESPLPTEDGAEMIAPLSRVS